MRFESKKDLSKETRKLDIETKRGKNFIDKYSGHSRHVIKGQLKKYMVFRKMNCKELIEAVNEDRKGDKIDREYKTEEKVNEFLHFLEDLDYSSNTRQGILGTVRAFYKYHDFPLHTARVKSIEGKTKPKNKVAQLDGEKVSRLYNAITSKRNKALLLFLYQTGQAREQISKLNFGDVAEELKEGKSPLMIDYGGRKGNSVDYCTFLGADGIHALEQYLDERVKKLEEAKEDSDTEKEKIEQIESVLTKDGNLRYKAPLFAKRDGINRLSAGAISEILKYIAQKTDVISDEKIEYADINPLRPHAFRHNFKSRLTPYVSSFVIEFLMGHDLGVEGEYFINEIGNKEDLRKYYAESIEEHLSIQTTTTEKEAYVSEDFEKLQKEKIQKLADTKELRKMIENWKDKWSDERMERKALEDKVEEQKEGINQISKGYAELKQKWDNEVEDLRAEKRELRQIKKALLMSESLDDLKEKLKEG